MGQQNEAREIFHQNRIPTYETPEPAAKTYMYMYHYKKNLDHLYETPEKLSVDSAPSKDQLKLMVHRAKEEGRTALEQSDVDRFLDAYGIPRAPGGLAKTVDQAIMTAVEVGYPVVLKIASQDILHKTDFNAVIKDVDSPQELETQFQTLLDRVMKAKPDARIDGVYVQKMIKDVDYELILGAKKDHDFGAIILFGLGGIGVELFKDFSIGLPPLNQVLARHLMEETRVYQDLSKGLRNKKSIDMKALDEIVVSFSNMIVDFPEMAEVDINPLGVTEGKVSALDARIIIDQSFDDTMDPYSHLVILPYPTKYVTPWKLKDGTELILRPIRPEDEPLEHELIRGLSPETSQFRFFHVIKDLSHEDLVRFCNIDYDREMAFIGETREGNKRIEIAVARLVLEPNKKQGEFAIVIADKYQGRGLGTKLTNMLIEWAKEKGVEKIYAQVMTENTKMVRLAEKLGFTTKKYGDGEVYAELTLNQLIPT
jgi:acetyltransferase